jgi:hypothetical protein
MLVQNLIKQQIINTLWLYSQSQILYEIWCFTLLHYASLSEKGYSKASRVRSFLLRFCAWISFSLLGGYQRLKERKQMLTLFLS